MCEPKVEMLTGGMAADFTYQAAIKELIDNAIDATRDVRINHCVVNAIRDGVCVGDCGAACAGTYVQVDACVWSPYLLCRTAMSNALSKST